MSGKPPFADWFTREDSPELIAAVTLIRAWYEFPENAAGGVFHVYLDDLNISSTNVISCMQYAATHLADQPGLQQLAWLLGDALLALSDDEQWEAVRRYRLKARGNDITAELADESEN